MPACDRDYRDIVEAVDHFAGALWTELFFLLLLRKS